MSGKRSFHTMPTNVHPEYVYAEKEFNNAQTDEDRIIALEEMIRWVPSHKGAETLRAQIRTRYKKLKQKVAKEQIKSKARGKTAAGIKKGELQTVLIGLTNSGKSSILKALTNAKPKIASYGFTTKKSEQGILNYEGTQIQIIDLPPVLSENFDKSIINTADTALLIIEDIKDVPELQKTLTKSKAKQIIVFNKADLLNEKEKRKTLATLKSKKYNFAIISAKTGEGLDELKEKLFQSFPIIRVYTRQPGKKADDRPLILPPKSTVKDATEKILHGYSKDLKRIKIWGPSSKFAGQQVGLKHTLKDKDHIEFQTK